MDTDKPRKLRLGRYLSESSLDVHIPSYPTSPRSLSYVSDVWEWDASTHSLSEISKAVGFLQADNELMLAAEIGDHKKIQALIRSKTVNVNQVDILGRNALHLATSTGDVPSVKLLLEAGVNANVKDSLGMTPLSVSLFRRPSLRIARLLFLYGAKLLPRVQSVDTGLFMQFIMFCTPTPEEVELIKLLVAKGSLVDDPEAPGDRQPLHFAAMSNNCTLIQLLYDLGADLFLTNHRNETPKEVAFSFKCREAVLLVESLEEKEQSKVQTARQSADGGSQNR